MKPILRLLAFLALAIPALAELTLSANWIPSSVTADADYQSIEFQVNFTGYQATANDFDNMSLSAFTAVTGSLYPISVTIDSTGTGNYQALPLIVSGSNQAGLPTGFQVEMYTSGTTWNVQFGPSITINSNAADVKIRFLANGLSTAGSASANATLTGVTATNWTFAGNVDTQNVSLGISAAALHHFDVAAWSDNSLTLGLADTTATCLVTGRDAYNNQATISTFTTTNASFASLTSAGTGTTRTLTAHALTAGSGSLAFASGSILGSTPTLAVTAPVRTVRLFNWANQEVTGTATVTAGQEVAYSARAYDANGVVLPSATFTWTENTVLTSSAGTLSGMFTSTSGTAGTMQATSGGINSATVTFVVQAAPLSYFETAAWSDNSLTLGLADTTATCLVTGRDAYGNATSISTFSTTNASFASLTSAGTGTTRTLTAHALLAGSGSLAFASGSVLGNTPTLTVTAPVRVVRLYDGANQEVTGTATVTAGQEVAYSARAYDANGAVIPGATFTWTETTVLTSSAGTLSGVFTSTSGTAGTMQATSGGINSATVTFVVQAAPLSYFETAAWSDNSLTLGLADTTATCLVTGRDAYGNATSISTFSTTNASFASLTSAGTGTTRTLTAHALLAGSGSLAFASGSVLGNTPTLTVTAPVRVVRLYDGANQEVTGTVTVMAGQEVAYSARAYDANGAVIPGATFTWTETTVLTSSAGTLSGVFTSTSGTAGTMQATSGGINSATVTFSVQPANLHHFSTGSWTSNNLNVHTSATCDLTGLDFYGNEVASLATPTLYALPFLDLELLLQVDANTWRVRATATDLGSAQPAFSVEGVGGLLPALTVSNWPVASIRLTNRLGEVLAPNGTETEVAGTALQYAAVAVDPLGFDLPESTYPVQWDTNSSLVANGAVLSGTPTLAGTGLQITATIHGASQNFTLIVVPGDLHHFSDMSWQPSSTIDVTQEAFCEFQGLDAFGNVVSLMSAPQAAACSFANVTVEQVQAPAHHRIRVTATAVAEGAISFASNAVQGATPLLTVRQPIAALQVNTSPHPELPGLSGSLVCGADSTLHLYAYSRDAYGLVVPDAQFSWELLVDGMPAPQGIWHHGGNHCWVEFNANWSLPATALLRVTGSVDRDNPLELNLLVDDGLDDHYAQVQLVREATAMLAPYRVPSDLSPLRLELAGLQDRWGHDSNDSVQVNLRKQGGAWSWSDWVPVEAGNAWLDDIYFGSSPHQVGTYTIEVSNENLGRTLWSATVQVGDLSVTFDDSWLPNGLNLVENQSFTTQFHVVNRNSDPINVVSLSASHGMVVSNVPATVPAGESVFTATMTPSASTPDEGMISFSFTGTFSNGDGVQLPSGQLSYKRVSILVDFPSPLDSGYNNHFTQWDGSIQRQVRVQALGHHDEGLSFVLDNVTADQLAPAALNLQGEIQAGQALLFPDVVLNTGTAPFAFVSGQASGHFVVDGEPKAAGVYTYSQAVTMKERSQIFTTSTNVLTPSQSTLENVQMGFAKGSDSQADVLVDASWAQHMQLSLDANPYQSWSSALLAPESPLLVTGTAVQRVSLGLETLFQLVDMPMGSYGNTLTIDPLDSLLDVNGVPITGYDAQHVMQVQSFNVALRVLDGPRFYQEDREWNTPVSGAVVDSIVVKPALLEDFLSPADRLSLAQPQLELYNSQGLVGTWVCADTLVLPADSLRAFTFLGQAGTRSLPATWHGANCRAVLVLDAHDVTYDWDNDGDGLDAQDPRILNPLPVTVSMNQTPLAGASLAASAFDMVPSGNGQTLNQQLTGTTANARCEFQLQSNDGAATPVANLKAQLLLEGPGATRTRTLVLNATGDVVLSWTNTLGHVLNVSDAGAYRLSLTDLWLPQGADTMHLDFTPAQFLESFLDVRTPLAVSRTLELVDPVSGEVLDDIIQDGQSVTLRALVDWTGTETLMSGALGTFSDPSGLFASITGPTGALTGLGRNALVWQAVVHQNTALSNLSATTLRSRLLWQGFRGTLAQSELTAVDQVAWSLLPVANETVLLAMQTLICDSTVTGTGGLHALIGERTYTQGLTPISVPARLDCQTLVRDNAGAWVDDGPSWVAELAAAASNFMLRNTVDEPMLRTTRLDVEGLEIYTQNAWRRVVLASPRQVQGAIVEYDQPRALEGLSFEVLNSFGQPLTEDVLYDGQQLQLRATGAWSGDEELISSSATFADASCAFFQLSSGALTQSFLPTGSTSMAQWAVTVTQPAARMDSFGPEELFNWFTVTANAAVQPGTADITHVGVSSTGDLSSFDRLYLSQAPDGGDDLLALTGITCPESVQSGGLRHVLCQSPITVLTSVNQVENQSLQATLLLEQRLAGGSWAVAADSMVTLSPGATTLSWQTQLPAAWADQAMELRLRATRVATLEQGQVVELPLPTTFPVLAMSAHQRLGLDSLEFQLLAADGSSLSDDVLYENQPYRLSVLAWWHGDEPWAGGELRFLDETCALFDLASGTQVQSFQPSGNNSSIHTWNVLARVPSGQMTSLSPYQLGAWFSGWVNGLIQPASQDFTLNGVASRGDLSGFDRVFISTAPQAGNGVLSLVSLQCLEAVDARVLQDRPLTLRFETQSSEGRDLSASLLLERRQVGQSDWIVLADSSLAVGDGQQFHNWSITLSAPIAGEGFEYRVRTSSLGTVVDGVLVALDLPDPSPLLVLNHFSESHLAVVATQPGLNQPGTVTSIQAFTMTLSAMLDQAGYTNVWDSLVVRVTAPAGFELVDPADGLVAFTGFADQILTVDRLLQLQGLDSLQSGPRTLELGLEVVDNLRYYNSSQYGTVSAELPMVSFTSQAPASTEVLLAPVIAGQEAAPITGTELWVPMPPNASSVELRFAHVASTNRAPFDGQSLAAFQFTREGELLHDTILDEFGNAGTLEIPTVLTCPVEDGDTRDLVLQPVGQLVDANSGVAYPWSTLVRNFNGGTPRFIIHPVPQPAHVNTLTYVGDSTVVESITLNFSSAFWISGPPSSSGQNSHGGRRTDEDLLARDYLQLSNLPSGAANQWGEARMILVDAQMVDGGWLGSQLQILPDTNQPIHLSFLNNTWQLASQIVVRPDLPPGTWMDAQRSYDLLGGLQQGQYEDQQEGGAQPLPADEAGPSIVAGLGAGSVVRTDHPSLSLHVVDSFPGINAASLRTLFVPVGSVDTLDVPVVVDYHGTPLLARPDSDPDQLRFVFFPTWNDGDNLVLHYSNGAVGGFAAGEWMLRVTARDFSATANGLGNEGRLDLPFQVDLHSELAGVGSLLAGPNPWDPQETPELAIQFQLESPIQAGSAVHVFVLDVAGQPVRHLEGTSQGISGTLMWDGRNASGEMVSNGAYLLVLDVKTDSKDVRMLFKLAVLKGGA